MSWGYRIGEPLTPIPCSPTPFIEKERYLYILSPTLEPRL